jgi:hypothetical protein
LQRGKCRSPHGGELNSPRRYILHLELDLFYL